MLWIKIVCVLALMSSSIYPRESSLEGIDVLKIIPAITSDLINHKSSKENSDSYYEMSLKLIFERVEVAYVDTNYYEYVFSNLTRYGRRSDYYINIEFKSKYPVDNNVTVHILSYEFSRNQYRRSFVEAHYKLCDFLFSDPYVGVYVAALGFECPVKAGIYTMANVTIPMADFPNVYPFEKGRFDIIFEVTATRKPLVEGRLYLTLKNEIKSKKRG